MADMRLHLRELDRCNAVGCEKPCEVEVFNQWNSLFGRYCRKHGEQKVKEAGEANVSCDHV